MIFYFVITFFLLWITLLGCARYWTNESSVSFFQRNESFLSLERLVFILFLILFMFLTAMRSANIGNDTSSYIKYFEYIAKYGVSNDVSFEKGFQVLCYSLSKISDNPHFFLIFISIFCYGLIGIYSLLYSSNLYLTTCLIFCFCFSPLTNILRQDIAMVICLFAYQVFKKGKVIPFVLLVLIASQFHLTAICMFFLLLKKLLPVKLSSVFIICSILIFFSCMGSMGGIFSGLLPRYDSYFSGDRVGSGWLATIFGLCRSIVMFLLARKMLNLKLREHSVMYSSFFAMIVFSSLGFQMNLLNRCALYFLFISTVELPNSIRVIKGNRSFWEMMLFCVLMMAYFLLILMVRPEWNSLTPYEMW